MAHFVLRLDGSSIRIFDGPGDPKGTAVGSSVIGGAYAAPYHKEFDATSPSVGMVLRPGGLKLISGAPANAFSGTHTTLDAVWQHSTIAEIVDRMGDARTLDLRLDAMEQFLLLRLPSVRAVLPEIAHALKGFTVGAKIADVVAEIRLSHRHFIKHFESTVGLTPKRYLRVQRFNRVMNVSRAHPALTWAEISAATGFSDQAHLNREFLALAGITPSQYRKRSLESAHHLAVQPR